jgi:hypothetical protein
MCWEIDYKFLAEHKKAQETRIKQEQRVGVIDQRRRNADSGGRPCEIARPATAAQA